MNKYLKNIFIVAMIVLIVMFIVCFSLFFIESISYPGFIEKRFNLDLGYLVNCYLAYAVFVSISYAVFLKNNLQNLSIIFWLKVNTIIFSILTLIVCLINLLEFLKYPNYIYSNIHVQPHLLFSLLKVYGILLLTNIYFYLISNDYKNLSFFNNLFLITQIAVKKSFNYKLSKSSILKVKNNILQLYMLCLLLFAVYGSIMFVSNFYKVDKNWKQENELRYTTGKMDIYGWIDEYLPRTRDVIKWCENQSAPVKLVTFDPEIIWMSYDALSRVFLTNCFYANIDPVSKSYDYFGADELLLVSVSKCDPFLEDTSPDPKLEIIKYFKIVNNDYICKSEEIVPNLYLYKNERRN